jgi:hypothetical protein
MDFESFEGPQYVAILSLLLKRMKLQIDSNWSTEITQPKIGVTKIEFF